MLLESGKALPSNTLARFVLSIAPYSGLSAAMEPKHPAAAAAAADGRGGGDGELGRWGVVLRVERWGWDGR